MDKKAVTITITDLDDEAKVLEALSKLFTTIFQYYLTNNNKDMFCKIAMSCGAYFGQLLIEAGLTPEDFKNKDDND